ncbi:MAG: peptide-methionine (S)-S-oxide reductase MsrA [Gammaproteobacteria bacterium]|nr:peptide-methionine (S)-S-oxide reductase MsrA [Gammaproteobacteria bacterium]
MKLVRHWFSVVLCITLGLFAQAEAQPEGASAIKTAKVRTAIFAGGCFWCMEPPYDKLPGVLETTAGYTGGKVRNPTYEEVSTGNTGHAEAVQIKYDASKISYAELLKVFWHNIDPLDGGGQFCDRGNQYRSEIFTTNEQEKNLALLSREKMSKKFRQPIVTKISNASIFYPAEQYHQDYYQKNSLRYKYYRFRCGRDKRLKELWGEAAPADK